MQRASTRLERQRYLVQKLWISWNIQISSSFSFLSSAPISFNRRKDFWHFYLIFFPHDFSSLSAFHPLLQKNLLYFNCFCLCPAVGLVSLLLSHVRSPCSVFPCGEEGLAVVWYQSLHHVGSECTLGHPAGLGLNCETTSNLAEITEVLCMTELLVVNHLCFGKSKGIPGWDLHRGLQQLPWS